MRPSDMFGRVLFVSNAGKRQATTSFDLTMLAPLIIIHNVFWPLSFSIYQFVLGAVLCGSLLFLNAIEEFSWLVE